MTDASSVPIPRESRKERMAGLVAQFDDALNRVSMYGAADRVRDNWERLKAALAVVDPVQEEAPQEDVFMTLPYERIDAAALVKAIRLKNGEMLLVLQPFGWHIDAHHIPNAPEQFSREGICRDHGWEVVCDYGPYVAIVRDVHAKPSKPATPARAVQAEPAQPAAPQEARHCFDMAADSEQGDPTDWKRRYKEAARERDEEHHARLKAEKALAGSARPAADEQLLKDIDGIIDTCVYNGVARHRDQDLRPVFAQFCAEVSGVMHRVRAALQREPRPPALADNRERALKQALTEISALASAAFTTIARDAAAAREPRAPQPGWIQHVAQHLRTVDASTDWADVQELRAWYLADVSELLTAIKGTPATKPPASAVSIREQWETPALRIVEAIHKHLAPNLDDNDGGEILHWILNLVEEVAAARPDPPAAPPAWQPIETAPKDGTKILCKGSLGPVVLYWRETDGDEWSAWTDGEYTFSPTHWMPLPPSSVAAPESEQA